MGRVLGRALKGNTNPSHLRTGLGFASPSGSSEVTGKGTLHFRVPCRPIPRAVTYAYRHTTAGHGRPLPLRDGDRPAWSLRDFRVPNTPGAPVSRSQVPPRRLGRPDEDVGQAVAITLAQATLWKGARRWGSVLSCPIITWTWDRELPRLPGTSHGSLCAHLEHSGRIVEGKSHCRDESVVACDYHGGHENPPFHSSPPPPLRSLTISPPSQYGLAVRNRDPFGNGHRRATMNGSR